MKSAILSDNSKVATMTSCEMLAGEVAALSVKVMSDSERELHIRHCGYLMQEAMRAGNRQEAEQWLQAEMLAIAQRSPEQQARMTFEIERGIDEGVDYFAVCGTRDGAAVRQEATQFSQWLSDAREAASGPF